MQLQQKWTIHMTRGKKPKEREDNEEAEKEAEKENVEVDEMKASQFVCLEDPTVKEVMVTILLYVTGKNRCIQFH